MLLVPCLECKHEISRFADACPRCGAHYTAAFGIYHRGLTYTGSICTFFWLFLSLSMHKLDNYHSTTTMVLLKDLRLLLLVLGVIFIGWGFLVGTVRRKCLFTEYDDAYRLPENYTRSEDPRMQ
jgi:hypothetical protein